MKTFAVRIGCEQLGALERFNVKASSSDRAWSKAFNKFVSLYPTILTDRLSVGGAIWRGREPRA